MAKSQWETVGAFQYNSRDLIGHGAFAVVFKGRNAEKPQDVVAIKCIQKKNLVKSRTLLEKEIRILSHLTAVKHENIVALLDYKETPQYVYLVMEYCNGGDLADYLQANGTLSEDSVKLFLRQLAKAMKALNGKGIVHRDLKPQNILLSSTKSHPKPHEITLKIADFGFARFLQDGVMAATLCGSPMYMAPEVIMSLPYDSKADLWSLGTIVYQCLVGKAPFQASSPQALKQFYEKSPNLKPKIPANTSPNMRDLLLRMLRRDAKDRIDFDELSVHPFLETERPGIPASGTPQTGPPGPTAAWASKPREIESAQKQSIPFPRSLPSRTAPIEEEDDFVIVPENLPSTTAGSVNVRHRSNESPSVEKQSQRPTSEPIPVPTQKEAYYQIQSSLRNSESSSSNCSSPATAKKGAGSRMEPASPSTSPQKRSLRGRSISTPGSAAGAKPASEARSSPISMRRVSSTDMYEDVASLSPPSVKFHVGTPPRGRTNSGNYYGSNSSLNRILTSSPPPSSFMAAACGPCGAIVPTSPTSPLRRSGVVSPPSLPAFFHGNQMCGGILGPDHGHGHCSPHRAQTMPDIARHARQCYRACQPADYFSSGNVAEKIGSAPCRRWSCAIMGPQGAEPQFACNNMLHDPCSPPDFDGVIFAAPELPEDTLLEREHNETLARLQLVLALADCVIELGEETGSPLALAAGNKESGAQSPNKHWAKPGRLSPLSPNSEDLPVVEKLATVREERHGEAAGWAEVDEERPLPSGGKFEPRRRRESGRRRDEEAEERSEIEPVAERLALLLKACRLLAAALHLARDEMTAHRLQASAAVRQVVSDLHARFQSCLSKVHKVYDSGPFSRDELHRHLGKISADRLLYQHAIRMCQSAALDELLGMSQACCVRYQTAQILLHCLAQTVKHSRDREILNEYRKSVEKRLFLLQQQGFVMAVDRSSSSN